MTILNQNLGNNGFDSQLQEFEKMLGYLNKDLLLDRLRIEDDTEIEIADLLLLNQEIQNRIDNPDQQLYQQLEASIVASKFGLKIDPVYYGKGISVIDGKKFIDFLGQISVDDLQDEQLNEGLKSILSQIKCLCGYMLEKYISSDFNNFDNFDELARNWGDIEKQYKRLGLESYVQSFTLSPYVNAYKGGYLRTLLGLRKMLRDGLYDPFKKTTTDSFIDLSKHKEDLNTYLDQIYEWAEKEILFKNSVPLVRHVLSLYMKTIDMDRKYFKLSDEKVNGILGKFEEIFSKLN